MKKGIFFKTFVFTAILLLAATLTIYLLVIIGMPHFYHSAKQDKLERQADELAAYIGKNGLEKSRKFLDQYIVSNNIGVMIQNENKDNLYSPPMFIMSAEDPKQFQLPVPGAFKAGGGPTEEDVVEIMHNFIETRRAIALNGKPHTIVLTTATQPIGEAARTLVGMLPFVLALIMVIAAAGALIYARKITKPVLHVSDTAVRMTNMEEVLAVKESDDEIGQLARNLNTLYRKLKQNITDLSDTNERLSDANERLNEEMLHVSMLERQRLDFFAAASHELKTPVAAASGMLEGMLEGVGVYKDRDKYIRECRKQMGRLGSLVMEILEIAKMNKDLKPEYAVLDIGAVVSGVIADYAAIAEKRGVAVAKELPGAVIRADRVLLEKALSNVLSNAIRFTGPGEAVHILGEECDRDFVLKVVNEGVKIEGDTECLFEPFSRSDSSRSSSTGGSGLGLYIVRQALQLMEIPHRLYNAENGVCFEMVLPKA